MVVVLALVTGYVLTSLLLLKYPHLIHKKRQLKFIARHISHRGGLGYTPQLHARLDKASCALIALASSANTRLTVARLIANGAAERLENTMEAFKYAADVGTDMLELDCHLTQDQQVVVSHDDHLLRTCGSQLHISQTLYKNLPLLQDNIRVDFCQSMVGKGQDKRIPLLKEVFEAFPDKPINIDIKVDNDLLIEKVNDLIKEYSREDITAWGNRSDVVCQKLFRTNPRIPLIFSLRKVVHVILLFWTGLLPFVDIKESLLEIVMPGIFLDSELILNWPISSKQRLLFWFMDKLLMRPALFKHLDKRGIQTYIWVLNREQDFERAFNCGAAGVMTDRILLLRNYLDRVDGQERSSGDHLISK